MSDLADHIRKTYPEPSPEQKAQFIQQAENIANRCRFGVVNTLFHQQPHTPAFTVEARFTRFLDSQEQPYQRRLTVSEEWSKLDYGWLNPQEVAVLLVNNNEGRYLNTPTEEEKKEMAGRAVLLGQGNPDTGSVPITPLWKVRPGECFQGEPLNLDWLYLRSIKGKVRCTLTILPS